MAPTPPEPDETSSLPNSLRVVLGSSQKLQILCLVEEGNAESSGLAEALTATIRRNSINLHLNELEELGWIRVAQLHKRRGSYARIWELTDPSFSWKALVAQLREQVPVAIPPTGDEPAPAATRLGASASGPARRSLSALGSRCTALH